jgi:PDZ domain-containing protein
VDAKGRLIGINSAIVSPSRGSIGLGFAVPINLAASVMRSLIATGTVRRGYLGVENPQDLTPELAEQFGLPKDTRGVIVTDITPGSPADKGGLKSSDVILSVNETPVSTIEEMHLAIGQMAPGAKTDLKVMRDGKPATIEVTLADPEESPNELLTGVTAELVTEDVRRKLDIDPRITGLCITAVNDSSPYVETLVPNMVIVSIGQEPITSLAAARESLKQPGRYLLLIYYRNALTYISLAVRKE